MFLYSFTSRGENVFRFFLLKIKWRLTVLDVARQIVPQSRRIRAEASSSKLLGLMGLRDLEGQGGILSLI